jgi:hypothetical protein
MTSETELLDRYIGKLHNAVEEGDGLPGLRVRLHRVIDAVATDYALERAGSDQSRFARLSRFVARYFPPPTTPTHPSPSPHER